MSDVTAPSSDTPTPLEALQQRHRKEQRDLVSRITQKKKQATKKTRKGVNDECERLEQELKERQAEEIRVLNGDEEEHVVESEPEQDDKDEVVDVKIEGLNINGTASTPPAASNEAGTGKKKNRQKERLARRKAEQDEAIARAEEEARNAPNPRELEKSRFTPLLASKGLALHEIPADGHCLYAAVADQLATHAPPLSLSPTNIMLTLPDAEKARPYKWTRGAAAGFIEAHGDAFEPFMEDALPEHVRKIRDTGEWGGHLELLALARSYGVRICVLHSDGRVDKIEDESGDEGAAGERAEIWLGYYRHSHGLGEHYNSLRRAESGSASTEAKDSA
ncbi:OTU protein [Didymella sp. IMI 355093]|nr:OTU protein [Didymella sp. IMI 355093]